MPSWQLRADSALDGPVAKRWEDSMVKHCKFEPGNDQDVIKVIRVEVGVDAINGDRQFEHVVLSEWARVSVAKRALRTLQQTKRSAE